MITPSRLTIALAFTALLVALAVILLAINNQTSLAQASRIDLTPEGGSATAGTPFNVTVTAYDTSDNIDTTYAGTIGFASSDAAAVLPAPYTFQLADSGSHVFSVTLVTSGNQSVTVVDTFNGSLTDSESWSVSAGAVSSYTVTSDNYSLETSIAFTVTVTAYDAYGNVATGDNTTVVAMSSSSPTMIFDGNGNGLFGEAGDNTKTLSAGTFDIQAKDNTAAEGIIITASAGTITTNSSAYTVENFRCFIATAAYGTPMAGEIQVLRDFRDKYLMTNPPGRLFVAAYYKLSPPVATFIADHDSLRAGIRIGLTPLLWLASAALKTTLLQKLAILALALVVVLFTAVCLRRIRRSRTA